MVVVVYGGTKDLPMAAHCRSNYYGAFVLYRHGCLIFISFMVIMQLRGCSKSSAHKFFTFLVGRKMSGISESQGAGLSASLPPFIEVFEGGMWINTETLEVTHSTPELDKHPGHTPKRWKQALRLRWQLWLEDKLPHENDLRMVSPDGFWLSPLDGLPVSAVPIIDGHIDHRVIDTMADYLASVPDCDPRDFGATLGVSLKAEHSHKRESARRASKVQRNLTFQTPRLDHWTIGAFFRPVEEVSGDFIETFELPDDRLLLALGDVSGHGLQGALLAASAGHFLRGLACHQYDLKSLCVEFHDGIQNDFLPGGFLTCWICLVDLEDGSYQSVCLGHASPILIPGDGAPPERQSDGKGAAVGLLKTSQFEATIQIEHGNWVSGSTSWSLAMAYKSMVQPLPKNMDLKALFRTSSNFAVNHPRNWWTV